MSLSDARKKKQQLSNQKKNNFKSRLDSEPEVTHNMSYGCLGILPLTFSRPLLQEQNVFGKLQGHPEPAEANEDHHGR